MTTVTETSVIGRRHRGRPVLALLALVMALASSLAAADTALAGTTEYCDQLLYVGERCKGPERHTYNDNYVGAYKQPGAYICGYFINPSTGHWINYFCGYSGSAGIYSYYRNNTDVFLDVYASNRANYVIRMIGDAAY
jgi:hypothetical protein